MFKKIKDNPSLVRDSQNRAIINTNPDEYIAAKRRSAKAKQENQQMAQMKSEIAELKELVKTLINRSQ